MRSTRGFTIAEILVYLLISLIVLGGIYQVLIGQNRLYSKQREVQDVRATLRAVGNLLAYELRQASAGDGDLNAISDTAFTVRSLYATGVICSKHPNGFSYGVYNTTGEFREASFGTGSIPHDSLFLFSAGSSGTADDVWLNRAVKALSNNPTAAGLGFCFWGDSATVPTEWAVMTDTAGVGLPTGVEVGAPIRFWNEVRYSLFLNSEDGRWWMGISLPWMDAPTRLVGPMQSAADSGLALIYYDDTGATTSDPTKVEKVDVILRAESFGKARSGSTGLPVVSEDSITITVYLRG